MRSRGGVGEAHLLSIAGDQQDVVLSADKMSTECEQALTQRSQEGLQNATTPRLEEHYHDQPHVYTGDIAMRKHSLAGFRLYSSCCFPSSGGHPQGLAPLQLQSCCVGSSSWVHWLAPLAPPTLLCGTTSGMFPTLALCALGGLQQLCPE
ncbi:hypothetical protein V5799_020868 [Amblyomma americanum]|uniref:Uncharacterized protein n=1 Tax=Amblyomma americanum TaxID=6943 RepID=A0AAQ4ETH5_AMBAM